MQNMFWVPRHDFGWFKKTIFENSFMAGETPPPPMAKVMNYFHFFFGVK